MRKPPSFLQLHNYKPTWLVNLPPQTYPLRNKALIADPMEGNQWFFISPDHKAPYLGGDT